MISKKLLEREYLKNKNPTRKIAKEIGCGHSIILYYMKIFDIPRRTISEALQGKKRLDISKRMRGNKNGYIDGRCSKTHYCIELNCNNEISYQNWFYGNKRCQSCALTFRLKKQWKDKNYREKMIEIAKKLWQNKEYRKDTIKAQRAGMKLKPNKCEKLLKLLLNKLLPNEYKYVGDGKVFFCGFNPDFINCNGQKKIIEMYGNYWHNRPEVKERDKRRLIAYN